MSGNCCLAWVLWLIYIAGDGLGLLSYTGIESRDLSPSLYNKNSFCNVANGFGIQFESGSVKEPLRSLHVPSTLPFCGRLYRTTLNPLFKSNKNDDIDGTCE